MPARIVRILAASVACLLGGAGLLTQPVPVLVGWLVAVLVVGPAVASFVHNGHPESGAAAQVGVSAALTVMAASAILAGLVTVRGVAAAVIIPLLLAAAAWRGRRSRADLFGSAVAGPRPAGTTPADRRHGPSCPAPAVAASTLGVSGSPTAALCVAWQRSYWMLCDLPAGSDRCEIVNIRQSLLDELERRDPGGFGRWLQSDPRACSDPGRYLSADH